MGVTEFIQQAVDWIGYSEENNQYKYIIDVYNSWLPHPRGYELQYDDDWCAGFVSACAIHTGNAGDFPLEVSVYYMKQGFISQDAYYPRGEGIPQTGHIIMYDWNGDGVPDHTGIVESVSGNTITVIEGNSNRAVRRLERDIAWEDILGYGVPTFTESPIPPEPPVPPTPTPTGKTKWKPWLKPSRYVMINGILVRR